MNLLHLVQDLFRQALTGLAPDVEKSAALVRPTQDARHGDYQANCAMGLAKELGKKPRDVAQEIVARLPANDMLEPPEVAGPGFINLRLRKEWLAERLRAVASDERLGVAPAAKPLTYVIDFSSPNVAKPLHVGHLRSTIIGDALARLLRFLGHKVVTDNHLGDWGTQFGILLWGYKNHLDAAAFKADPVRELARLYVLVRQMMKVADEDAEEKSPDPVAEAARLETAKLHAGDEENVRLWKMFMPYCLEELNVIYRRLDIKHDVTLGESFYNPLLPGVVESLAQSGIACLSEGAVVVFPECDQAPSLVRKRDGAFTYTTTDLATVRYRVETWNPDAVLYVVDFRQSFHFRNLFAVARQWGYDKVRLEHVSFGSVLGEDRKPLGARKGGALELAHLLDEAVQRGRAAYEKSLQERREAGQDVSDLTPEQRAEIADVVGIGAVKYADLCQNRTTDYVFSWDKMLAMSGNTATYMQYVYARNRAIFRMAAEDPQGYRNDPPPLLLDQPEERALALKLLQLEEALLTGAEDLQPNALTAYLWDLANIYNGFYQKHKVLKAETPDLRRSRLLLCDLTGRAIQLGLTLLGIRTVERM